MEVRRVDRGGWFSSSGRRWKAGLAFAGQLVGLRPTATDSVGFLTAVAVLGQMPELGRCNRQETAALAGLAPWTRQSGPWEGQRHIGGGRAEVRQALYMAAVAVARMKPTVLGQFYQRLRDAGKPAKVALTAVMRKLLILMNHTLKNPN